MKFSNSMINFSEILNIIINYKCLSVINYESFNILAYVIADGPGKVKIHFCAHESEYESGWILSTTECSDFET